MYILDEKHYKINNQIYVFIWIDGMRKLKEVLLVSKIIFLYQSFKKSQ